MFTLPDRDDAVTPVPPFGSAGTKPNAFYADCDTSPPGTVPRAEDFNELIVNLRALLAQAHILGVKGDETMLWRAILALSLITTNVTIQVAPSGSASPVNPFAGDAFNTLGAAISWLARYRIVPPAIVTISVAAGTYAESRIEISHPNALQITIVGAASSTTILHFTGSSGISARADMPTLQKLTIEGTRVAATYGLILGGMGTLVDDVVVDGFDTGMYVDGRLILTGQTTVRNCLGVGVSVNALGILGGTAASAPNTTLTLQNNGGANKAALYVNGGAYVGLWRLLTNGSPRGLEVVGNATADIGQIQVVDATVPGEAVKIWNGATLNAYDLARTWEARNAAGTVFHTFLAQNYGFIRSAGVLVTGNRSTTSPALNTLGNTQAYIQG